VVGLQGGGCRDAGGVRVQCSSLVKQDMREGNESCITMHHAWHGRFRMMPFQKWTRDRFN
jgi:hypothetical protein